MAVAVAAGEAGATRRQVRARRRLAQIFLLPRVQTHHGGIRALAVPQRAAKTRSRTAWRLMVEEEGGVFLRAGRGKKEQVAGSGTEVMRPAAAAGYLESELRVRESMCEMRDMIGGGGAERARPGEMNATPRATEKNETCFSGDDQPDLSSPQTPTCLHLSQKRSATPRRCCCCRRVFQVIATISPRKKESSLPRQKSAPLSPP